MNKSSTILLIEDNPDDAELLECAFRKASIANPLLAVTDAAAAVEYVGGTGGVVAWTWGAGAVAPAPAVVQAMRTEIGRPSSSIRLSAWTATSTSVARRRSVRERNPSPITCLNLPMAASARARFV